MLISVLIPFLRFYCWNKTNGIFLFFYYAYCTNIKAHSVVQHNINEKDIGFLLSHSSTPFLSSTPMILIRNVGFIVHHLLVVPCPRRASGRRRAFSQIHAWYITQPAMHRFVARMLAPRFFEYKKQILQCFCKC